MHGVLEGSADLRIASWEGDVSIEDAETSLVRSPRSMMLSPDENVLLRIPDFGTFMHHQEHLQQLLVDIHKDPDGFETHVADRRTQLEQTPAPLGGSADTDPLGSLADYSDMREVGKGRFSTVFFCRRREDSEPCAMKRITLSMMPPAVSAGAGGGAAARNSRNGGGSNGGNSCGGAGEMAFEKCLKEVGLLKNLKSPHIVSLHGCFVERGSLWIVLEWVDGGDLRSVLSNMRTSRQRFDELTIWSYTTQICEALKHMHGQRIMHRDLKPANILIGSDGTLKLGDLGLGRYLHVKSVMAYSQVGTPLYMSPEVLMGRGHTFASDIWSLGCVVYEMAMLQSAFAEAGLTMEKLFRKVVDGAFAAVDTRVYSRALCNLVENLVVVDPAERPQIDRVAAAASVAHASYAKGLPLDSPCTSSSDFVSPGMDGDEGGGGGSNAAAGVMMAAPAFGCAAPHQHQQQQQQHHQQQQQYRHAMAPPAPRAPQHHQQQRQHYQQHHATPPSPVAMETSSAGEERCCGCLEHCGGGGGGGARAGGGGGGGAERSHKPETLQQLPCEEKCYCGRGGGGGAGAARAGGAGAGGGGGAAAAGSTWRPETPLTERGSDGDPLSPRQEQEEELPSAGSKRMLSASSSSMDGLSTSLTRLRIRLSGICRRKKSKVVVGGSPTSTAAAAAAAGGAAAASGP